MTAVLTMPAAVALTGSTLFGADWGAGGSLQDAEQEDEDDCKLLDGPHLQDVDLEAHEIPSNGKRVSMRLTG